MTYGWLDPMGLARHNEVVTGQPRSQEWLVTYGWPGLLWRLVRTTFHSFWGQFGWMGVVLPSRIYQLLALFSGGLAVGFFWWLVDPHRRKLSRDQKVCLLLLLVSAILTVIAFAWYNLSFVQHQGRYLFPALIPIGLAVALGIDRWERLLPHVLRTWLVRGVFAGLALFDIYCLYRFILPALAG
jgi:hypothetical protein